MRSWVYSRWDGTQRAFGFDARKSLDALSQLLMEGQSAREALAWMRQHGFELAGLDMRVMGIEELLEELRQQLEALHSRHRMDEALRGPSERLERILSREQEALRAAHGFESARMNEFLERRHASEGRSLAERIERFRDHRFEDPAAGEEFRELLEELERIRALERFLAERGGRFRGREPADYETAQRLRERIEALERLARDLASGNLETLSPDELRELLGDAAADSLIWLRDLEPGLRREGFLRGSGDEVRLTPRAIRRIGAHALAEVYGALRRDRVGGHETDARGVALPRPDATRPYEYGAPLDLEVVRTLLRALRRGGGSDGAIELRLEDLELREMDHATHATTVLLLDMSWSMSWAGRFAAAKRVAIALDHLVRTRFPRDHFFVVGFSTRARPIRPEALAEVVWDVGEPFTNLQEGLMLAERLIARHPSASPQILIVTDGQPTAYFRGRQLRVEWPMGFGGVSPHAVAETLKQVRRVTRRGITINTFMLDDSPELLGFVEQMTRMNRGRAFYTEPGLLGSYLMVDYLTGRRRRQA